MQLRTLSIHLVVAIVLCALSCAQDTGKSDKPAADFSKEAYVVEESYFSWAFENDGTARREHAARIRIQSDSALQTFGVLTLAYQKATETLQVDQVRVHKPGGSVVESPLDQIEDMPAKITREAPFYSDIREKHVPVKGLGIGDVLEYKCHWVEDKPLIPGQFWMAFPLPENEIVLRLVIRISVPRDRPVKVKSKRLAPVISEEGGRRIYTWTSPNLEKKPQSEVDLAQLAIRGNLPAPDILFSSFQTWQEVARWYDQLQRERVAPTPEIRAKAAELTAHAPDQEAKLRAIYGYVSSEFRYIGVAFGIGRYQPHAAGEVLANQYGDCKDKTTLLASLLSAVGITSLPALINSAKTIDLDVPSPGQFDHVITAVPRGGEILWLDTTAEVAPPGYLLLPLRNKDALLVSSNPAFHKTPVDPPFPTSWTFKMDSKLDEKGTLTGKVQQSLRGDLEVQFRALFRKLPRDRWKDLVQRISYASGFGGKVSEVTVERLDTTGPLRFSYSYEREDFADWKNRRIVVPAPSALLLPPEADGKPPAVFWLGAPGEFVFDSTVKLPEGYRGSAPAEKHIKEDFIEYHASYDFSGGVLSGHYRFLLKQREVSGTAVTAYKEFAKKVSENRDQYVDLNSGSASKVVVTPTLGPRAQQALVTFQKQIWELPDSSDPKAVEAENEAKDAFQRGLLEEGLRAYRRAVTIDPTFTRVWIVLGQMYMATMQRDAGLEAMRNAVRSAPEKPICYKVLAFALMSLDRRKEAIAVWQDLAKVVPDERDLGSNLGNLLVLEKRYKEALPYLENEIKLYPDKAQTYAALAAAYLRLGEDEKALLMFDQVLKLSPGPDSLNNIAYMLGDEGKHLDVALKYAQRAVREEEEQSRSVKLASLSLEDLRHTGNLGNDWDTLGWVYFRRGDAKRSEEYLRAAWSVRQDPVIGYHLGQVYEAQHRRADAVHIYRLVASVTGARGEQAEAVDSAKKRFGTLNVSPRYAEARGPIPEEELSKGRTVVLPRVGNVSGVAELFVLLGPGPKVEDIKFISGSQQMRDLGKSLAGAKFNVVFPEDSSARIVRRGILGCYPHSGCSFAMVPVELVNSVE